MKNRIDDVRGLNRDDVLAALGLTRRRTLTEGLITAAGIFAAGAFVGTTVALMVAPKTGRDLRGELRNRANDLTHRVKRSAQEVRGAIEERKDEMAAARSNGKMEAQQTSVRDWRASPNK